MKKEDWLLPDQFLGAGSVVRLNRDPIQIALARATGLNTSLGLVMDGTFPQDRQVGLIAVRHVTTGACSRYIGYPDAGAFLRTNPADFLPREAWMDGFSLFSPAGGLGHSVVA